MHMSILAIFSVIFIAVCNDHLLVGIPIGTSCAPLLADLFLYSYEAEFLQILTKNKKIKDA